MIGTAHRPLTGRHVSVIACAFFAIVFVVNGAMVFLARGSWPGLTDTDAYRRGLAYNATLREAETQNERGWRTELAAVPNVGRIAFRALDANGAPVPGLVARIELRRPGALDADRSIALQEVGNGTYDTAIQLGAGRWLAELDAHQPASGATFRQVYEITVAP